MSQPQVGPESEAPTILNSRFVSSHGLPGEKQGHGPERRIEGLRNVAYTDCDVRFFADRDVRDFQCLQYGLGGAADGAPEKRSIAHVSAVTHQQQNRKAVEPSERFSSRAQTGIFHTDRGPPPGEPGSGANTNSFRLLSDRDDFEVRIFGDELVYLEHPAIWKDSNQPNLVLLESVNEQTCRGRFHEFFYPSVVGFLPALVKAVDKTVCIELLNESRVDKNFRLDRFDPRILFDQSIQNGLDAFEAGILFAWKHIFCNSPVIRFGKHLAITETLHVLREHFDAVFAIGLQQMNRLQLRSHETRNHFRFFPGKLARGDNGGILIGKTERSEVG